MLSSDNIKIHTISHNRVVKQPDQQQDHPSHRVRPKTDPLGCKGIKTHTNTHSEVSFWCLILEIDGDWG